VSPAQASHWRKILALVSAGEGVLLAAGLETCFGIGQYRLIMLLGALGGFGIGLLVWLVRSAWPRGGTGGAAGRSLLLAAILPALAVFLLAFVWRIVPLIREELKYSL